MPVSLDSILTAIQNLTQAVNNAARTYLGVQGIRTQCGVNAETVVFKGAGRLASVSMIVNTGQPTIIYDAAVTGDYSQPLVSFPNTVIGVTFVNLPFTRGILIKPATSDVVTVSYSTVDDINYMG